MCGAKAVPPCVMGEDRISDVHRLYLLIQEKPKSARLKSKLACLLAQQQRLKQSNSCCVKNDVCNLQEQEKDPLYWARQAIETAPEKPFGYAATSFIAPYFPTRMEHLTKAIELSFDAVDNTSVDQRVLTGLLVRQLVEPREEEARQVCGKVGKASKAHPSKRPLDKAEQGMYDRLVNNLQTFWQEKNKTCGDVEYVALREYRLGMFFRKLEPSTICKERSRAHFERVLLHLSSDPSSPHFHDWSMARFWLATLGSVGGSRQASVPAEQQQQLDRCPKEYVVGLYSTFAERFDKLLVDKLEYQTPTLLRALLDQHYHTQTATTRLFSRVLDLGCGTGLSGLAFDDCADRLEGIDLSPEMVAKARERGFYDRLSVGDVLDVFEDDGKDAKSQPSLVIACDVFCYIGNLKPTFERIFEGLGAGSVFAFSTELLVGATAPFELQSCARFAHSRAYIEELSTNTSFDIVAIEQSVIRKNQGEDVQGLLTVLSKQ